MFTLYDDNNIFAKILRDEAPCHKLYEDEFSLSFMDIRPVVEGHALVISKASARNILDCPPAVLAGVILTTQRIARGVKKAFDAQGVTIKQFNEVSGGQEVFHLHFHVLPRKTGVPLRPRPASMASDSSLSMQATAIRKALSSLGMP